MEQRVLPNARRAMVRPDAWFQRAIQAADADYAPEAMEGEDRQPLRAANPMDDGARESSGPEWQEWIAATQRRLRMVRRQIVLLAISGLVLLTILLTGAVLPSTGVLPSWIGFEAADPADGWSRSGVVVRTGLAFGLMITTCLIVLLLPCWLGWRRALRNVPRLDGAACPNCARPLLAPVARADQANGALTMRCERCERRWPVASVRQRWRSPKQQTYRLFQKQWVDARDDLHSPSGARPLDWLTRFVPGLAAIMVVQVAIMIAFMGRAAAPMLVWLAFPFVMLGAMLLHRGWWGRSGEERHCVRCDHALTPGEEVPQRCAECGAHLRVRAALRRGTLDRRPALAALGAAILLLGVPFLAAPFALLATGTLAARLPTSMLIRQSVGGGLLSNFEAQAELARRTLTPAETRALAEAHFEALDGQGSGGSWSRMVLQPLVAQSDIPPDLLRRVFLDGLELSCSLRSIPDDPERVELVLRAVRAQPTLNTIADTMYTIRSIEVDGVSLPDARRESWSLLVPREREDRSGPDAEGRSASGSKVRFASGSTPGSRLALLRRPPGPIRVRIDGWTMVAAAPAGMSVPLRWMQSGEPEPGIEQVSRPFTIEATLVPDGSRQ